MNKISNCFKLYVGRRASVSLRNVTSRMFNINKKKKECRISFLALETRHFYVLRLRKGTSSASEEIHCSHSILTRRRTATTLRTRGGEELLWTNSSEDPSSADRCLFHTRTHQKMCYWAQWTN